MKNILLLMTLFLVNICGNATGQETFKDTDVTNKFRCPTFKLILKRLNIVSDTSHIMQSELCNVKRLTINANFTNGPTPKDESVFKAINSLEGLECFTNLEIFEFKGGGNIVNEYGEVLSLKLPAINSLKNISICNFVQIETLDVSSCQNLEKINCVCYNLKHLILGQNNKLRVLICKNSFVSTLDVSQFPRLDSLYFESGLLNKLDLRKNKELRYLNCSYNRIESLDLRENTNLNTVIASKQASYNVRSIPGHTGCLKEILLPDKKNNHDGITQLIFDDNKLEYLELSKLPNLEYLDCQSNLIKELDVSQHPKLKSLICSYNFIEQLDLSNNTQLEKLHCAAGQICMWTPQFNTRDYKSILKKLMLYYNENGKNPNLKELSYKGCTSIKPINLKRFPNLSYLDCSFNNLKSLDLQSNRKLQTLICTNNGIKKLSLHLQNKLEILNCSYNPIKSLNVENNPLMKEINLNGLPICKLDLSENALIKKIDCADNSQFEKGQIVKNKKKLSLLINETMDTTAIYSIVEPINRKLDIRQGERTIYLPY